MSEPKIVCLCGSTRFRWEFEETALWITLLGHIYLSVGGYAHADPRHNFLIEPRKELVDKLHKEKIDRADMIFVLNVNNYIGESTKSEIDFAERNKIHVHYINDMHPSSFVKKLLPDRGN